MSVKTNPDDLRVDRSTIPLDRLQRQLRDGYTRREARDGGQAVFLRIGCQAFCVTPVVVETVKDAEWMRAQLAIALSRLVRNCQRRWSNSLQRWEYYLEEDDDEG